MTEPIQPELHELMNSLARGLDEVFNGEPSPPRAYERKVGFCLFTFNFGQFDHGRVNYISNADRADMIAAVKEWLARAEGRISDEPRTPQ